MRLKWPRNRLVQNSLLIAGGLVAGLLLVEGGLRIYEALGPNQLYRDTQGRVQTIPDEVLGIRVEPYAPGHDAKGFRNDKVPEQADIIAVGDSQTWGFNVVSSHAWPQTLERLSEKTVYNMALGFYGPVEYWLLTKEALQLSPDTVIIGLYFANDIWGAYNTVYLTDRCPDLRVDDANESLFTSSLGVKADTLVEEISYYEPVTQYSAFEKIVYEVGRRSAIIRLLSDKWDLYNVEYFQGKAWAQDNPEKGAYYENGDIRTILTPAYRLLGLDMDEPAIYEGLRITKETILRIQSETENAGVNLLIMLIPTSESVFADAVASSQGSLSTTYQKLYRMENLARNELISLCNANGIEYVDPLPVLKNAVLQNEYIYPQNSDGHPIERGYYLLADTVWQKLKELGWLN